MRHLVSLHITFHHQNTSWGQSIKFYLKRCKRFWWDFSLFQFCHQITGLENDLNTNMKDIMLGVLAPYLGLVATRAAIFGTCAQCACAALFTAVTDWAAWMITRWRATGRQAGKDRVGATLVGGRTFKLPGNQSFCLILILFFSR